jgi:hypothetical protein
LLQPLLLAAKVRAPREAVRLALKNMGRETSARQAQARALGWNEIKEFIGSAGKGRRGDREPALLSLMPSSPPQSAAVGG